MKPPEIFPLTPPSPNSLSLGGEGNAGLKLWAFSRSRVRGAVRAMKDWGLG